MPSRCPLFPLDLVLFPGEAQPLHIFEPRYRQLLADCLEGDELFGITSDADPRADRSEPSPRCARRRRCRWPLQHRGHG